MVKAERNAENKAFLSAFSLNKVFHETETIFKIDSLCFLCKKISNRAKITIIAFILLLYVFLII